MRLVLWINSDKGYNGMQKVGDRFAELTGVRVSVQHPDGATEKFQAAAAAGRGPDIMCWAHNAAGEWARSGLIVPVRPGRKTRQQIEPLALQAFTFDGQTWGYPLAIEAIGLIYNRALVSKPPTTFDDVIALDKRLATTGKKALLWPYNLSYYTWPILTGAGGFIFGTLPNGKFDTLSIGINNAGALRGVEKLVALINGGQMPSDARYSQMESEFAKGRLAMMIAGPWAWDNARRSGIDFGVAALPRVDLDVSQPARPFVGVLGCMISVASKVKDVAIEFIEHHLLSVESLKMISADVPLGVPANLVYYAEISADGKIAATMENARAGVLMPTIPEMGRFFPAMDAALESITNGRQSPKEALDSAAARMRVR